jgi:hypothetical protein
MNATHSYPLFIFCWRIFPFSSITNMFLSSANKTIFVSFIFIGRSSIYNKKQYQPENWTCGIPHLISFSVEKCFLWILFLLQLQLITTCFWCANYDSNHQFAMSLIPYEFNLASRISWFIAPYAFQERSALQSQFTFSSWNHVGLRLV